MSLDDDDENKVKKKHTEKKVKRTSKKSESVRKQINVDELLLLFYTLTFYFTLSLTWTHWLARAFVVVLCS